MCGSSVRITMLTKTVLLIIIVVILIVSIINPLNSDSFQPAIENPIIGILSQEKYIVKEYSSQEHVSFIAASYVKHIESSGGRVVPIWIGQDRSYYERVVKYTNGILFPGGGTYFDVPGGYGEAANIIYSIALKLNEEGTYYPLWGTCLGFQALMFGAMKGKDIRVDCYLKFISIPLNFSEGYKNSKIFSKASDEILQILSNQNVTYNLHKYCITENVLKENNLLEEWQIVSTNQDKNGIEFVSTLESTRYPFYGTQYHPEKNAFEFRKRTGMVHSSDAVKSSQYFANFFVDECRKNNHSFPSEKVEKDSLIYNFSPDYTGKKGSYYEQIYFFNKHHVNTHQLK